MQTERRVMAANPQTKPTELGCESADKWLLPSTSTIAICYILRHCVSRRRRKMYCGHARLSVRGCTPTLLHGPGCNLGRGRDCPPPSCALLGGFTIGARVALLWQHNANPSYKLASIPGYDHIVRTLGGVCARCWPVTVE